jgi:hypothetical protein
MSRRPSISGTSPSEEEVYAVPEKGYEFPLFNSIIPLVPAAGQESANVPVG